MSSDATRGASAIGCSQDPQLTHPLPDGRPPALAPGVPPLGLFYIYLTEGCNLACQHCWITPALMRNLQTGGHVSAARLLDACRQAQPLGLRRVKLTGGEPLLHPEFNLLARGIAELGLGLWMECNLTLLDEQNAATIRDTMRLVSTSLDGATPEIHDPFRGQAGSFETTCRAVRELAPDLRIQVIMSVHEGNRHQIEPMLALAKSLGAESVKYNMVQSMGRGDKMHDQGRTLDVAELIRLGRLVEHEWGPRHGIQTFWSWPLAFHPISKLLRPRLGTCGIDRILGILPSGNYALCGIGRDVPDLVYGTLDDDLARLWNEHPTLARLREAVPGELEGVCGNCLVRRACKGSCVAVNYHDSGSLTHPHWFCEQAAQRGLFPQERLKSPYLPEAVGALP